MSPDDLFGLINNPAIINRGNPFVNNQRVKSIISQGVSVDKNTIAEFMERPQDNEYNLQAASWAMYFQSMVYLTLQRIERETPRLHYYAIPENVTKDEMTKDVFKKEKRKVDSILKVLKPVVTFKDIITQMVNQGKVTYVPRISYDDKEANFFTFQMLPANYVKIVGFGSEERFVVMFDMSLFLSGIYDPAQYAPFIQDKWHEMITRNIVVPDTISRSGRKSYKFNIENNYSVISELGDIPELNGETWFYWYRIPQNQAFTFSQDGGHPNAFPDMVALLPDIVDLTDYKQLQQALLSKGATALLTAEAAIKTEAPVGTDPSYINPETLLGITDYITQRVGDTIVPVVFPVSNWKLHSIQEDVSPATSVVTSRIKDVVNSSALGGLISNTDKPSIITVKTARDLQEAKSRYYIKQFENAVNRIIKESFNLKYDWKINFWGYCFSEPDDLKLMKEMILSGVKGLMPRFLSAYNLTVEDYATMYNMCEVNDIKIIKDETIYQVENNKEMQHESLEVGLEQQRISTATKIKDTGINETKKVGRPGKSMDNIESDSTASSIEGGGNDSSVKDFAMTAFAIDEGLITDMDDEEVFEIVKEEWERENQ